MPPFDRFPIAAPFYAVFTLIVLGVTTLPASGQGVDPLTRGVTVPSPVTSCSAVPVTETGPALTNRIKSLEEDVKRDMRQLRDLDRRFGKLEDTFDELGDAACRTHGELQRKLITDSIGALFTTAKALDDPKTRQFFRSLSTGRGREWLQNYLSPSIALRSGPQEAHAAFVRRVLQGGYENATMQEYRAGMNTLEAIYKTGVALMPAFECSPGDEEPKFDPLWKVAATGMREVLSTVHPALGVLTDEDNWLAGAAYFTTRNRIAQFDELTMTQLGEWKTYTCNLQRHTKTLRDARLKARPVTATANARSAKPKGGSAIKAIGSIAVAGVAIGGGLYAYNAYKTTQEENAALLDDISRLPTTTTTTTTPATTAANYSASASRSCTLGAGNSNPLSSSFIEPCSIAVAGGSCGPTSFTFTVTGSTVRDCGGWLANAQVSGNTLSALYTGVCGAGGITVSGPLGGPVSGTGTCRGNTYIVTISTSRQ